MPKKLNLAVIFGGQSGEHEVSIKSASQVIKALDKNKYNIIPIAITKKGNWLIGGSGQKYLEDNLEYAQKEGGISVEQSQKLVSENNLTLANFFAGDKATEKIDLALPIVHGQYVEDGRLQGMLDLLGIPYVFSGVLASAMAMNKEKTKLLAKRSGLKIAKEIIISQNKKFDGAKAIAKLGLPVVVKPVELGSSVGSSIVHEESGLMAAVDKALSHGGDAMLEQYIKGRELTVAVMGRKKLKALPVVEIKPQISGWFDYQAKYQAGGSEEICPADIPEDTAKKAQKQALKIYKALGCRDLARADFIWSENDEKLYFLEINTIPGMTATSLAPQAAKAAGLEFSVFLDKLISGALQK